MQKTLKRISGLFMLVFLVFAFKTLQARTFIAELNGLISKTKEYCEQYFSTILSKSGLLERIAISTLNFETQILNDFSKSRIYADYEKVNQSVKFT